MFHSVSLFSQAPLARGSHVIICNVDEYSEETESMGSITQPMMATFSPRTVPYTSK